MSIGFDVVNRGIFILALTSLGQDEAIKLGRESVEIEKLDGDMEVESFDIMDKQFPRDLRAWLESNRLSGDTLRNALVDIGEAILELFPQEAKSNV